MANAIDAKAFKFFFMLYLAVKTCDLNFNGTYVAPSSSIMDFKIKCMYLYVFSFCLLSSSDKIEGERENSYLIIAINQ